MFYPVLFSILTKLYVENLFSQCFVKETEGGILHEKRGVMFVSEALPDDNH